MNLSTHQIENVFKKWQKLLKFFKQSSKLLKLVAAKSSEGKIA